MNRAAEQITRVIEPDERSKFSKPLTLAAMSLGFGVVQLDVTIVNTALNSIFISLGGGVSQLRWVVSAYTIAFAALILTAIGVIAALEDDLRRPVLTANQVSLWYALRVAGAEVGVDDYGQLFQTTLQTIRNSLKTMVRRNLVERGRHVGPGHLWRQRQLRVIKESI